MKGQYILPAPKLEAFNCPHCHVYSSQTWSYLNSTSERSGSGYQYTDKKFLVSYCAKCEGSTIWENDNIIYPQNSIAEPVNADLPQEIIQDYNEAAKVFSLSPRSSAALLRLAIQKLCKHLGEDGKNINNDIKSLVAKGLPNKVQEALDSVRVIGNDAVHPGTLDLNDNREIAAKLFKLVNFIATKMISEPKEIDELYSSLPADKLKGIEDRDK
jgi:hypothetical protein